MSVQLNEQLNFRVMKQTAGITASVVNISVDLLKKNSSGEVLKLDGAEMTQHFVASYKGQVFRTGQQLAVDFNGTKLECIVGAVEHADTGHASSAISDMGLLVPNVTSLVFSKRAGSSSKIAITGSGGGGGGENLFRSGFDFEQMGIGGLGAEFQKIFRRAFASRMYPTSLVKEMGFSHVKGILLYGPPGCGKVRFGNLTLC